MYYLSDAADDYARALEASENDALPLESARPLSGETQIIVWDLIHTANRADSRNLAEAVCDGLKSARVPSLDRGVKTARFAVLKGSRMPAVLVEVGFISNPLEGKRLDSPDYRQQLADGIHHGIGVYTAKREYRWAKSNEPAR